MTDQRGFATTEFVLSIGVLLLPMVLLVTLLPTWSEGRLAATTAADAAARAGAIAVADGGDPAAAVASAAGSVLTAHALAGAVRVREVTPDRVTVEVDVRLRALPLGAPAPNGANGGPLQGFTTTASATVLVDTFRAPDPAEGSG